MGKRNNWLHQVLAGLMVVMLLLAAGCKPGPSKIDAGGYAIDTALAQEFAAYTEIPVRETALVQPYQAAADLSNVVNGDRFTFSEPARTALLQNSFVVLPARGEEFFMLYEINRYDNIPNLVTTDAILHNYHLFYSHLLKNIENQALIPELQKMNTSLLHRAQSDYAALQGTAWENAARRNLAFFAVGSVLLAPGTAIPPAVQTEVGQEIELIKQHDTTALSPVMAMGSSPDLLEGLKEDYTQYIPRGHYAKTEALQQYFQTMMWYGRLTFRLKDADETRSAILMTLALQDGAGAAEWSKVYSTTTFMVGKSDDIGYSQYGPILTAAYGTKIVPGDLPGNQAGFDQFCQLASQLEPPLINSIPIFDATIQPDREKEIKGFRFMGQRYTLDAEIFQHLVYREVGENPSGERRMLPTGLDIPAALGSAAAQNILQNQGAFQFQDYATNMQKMQMHVAGLKDAWHQNLYWSWLNTLLPLTTAKPQGYPSFMRNEAWQHKELATFLGSWAELKHDTILYAKQVYAEMGGGGREDIDDRGYVEPNPHLYARLAALTALTRDGLQNRSLLSEADSHNLDQLYSLVMQLKVISEKELANEALTEAEYELIRTLGGQLEHFWLEAFRAEGLERTSQLSDFPAMIIADVATNPPAEVLEVGTGYVDHIYAIVPVAGSLRIARGGVYSYHEFPWPASDRLTDQKWKDMLSNGQAPAPPAWTSHYRVEGTAAVRSVDF